MKINTKGLNKKDLQPKLEELHLDLMKNNSQRETGTQPKSNIKNIKKNIARIKTALKQEEQTKKHE